MSTFFSTNLFNSYFSSASPLVEENPKPLNYSTPISPETETADANSFTCSIEQTKEFSALTKDLIFAIQSTNLSEQEIIDSAMTSISAKMSTIPSMNKSQKLSLINDIKTTRSHFTPYKSQLQNNMNKISAAILKIDQFAQIHFANDTFINEQSDLLSLYKKCLKTYLSLCKINLQTIPVLNELLNLTIKFINNKLPSDKFQRYCSLAQKIENNSQNAQSLQAQFDYLRSDLFQLLQDNFSNLIYSMDFSVEL